MPRLGIISDTHGRLKDSVFDVFADVDYIIHAGDIGKPSILWELEAIAPTIAVLGNNDYYQDYGPGVDWTAAKTIGDVRIFVCHMPVEAAKAARTGEYGLVIHGHTHVPRDEVKGACRIINPGSATRPREGTRACVALLTIEAGAIGPATTVLL